MANAKCRVYKELGIRRAGRAPGPSAQSVMECSPFLHRCAGAEAAVHIVHSVHCVRPWPRGEVDGLCGRKWTGVDETGSASAPAAGGAGGRGPGAEKGSVGPREVVRAGRTRGRPRRGVKSERV